MKSMHWLHVPLIFVAIVWASHGLCAAKSEMTAAGTKALSDTEQDAFIEMAMRSGGLPGLQTVIVKNGQIARAKSYGYAVLDAPGPRQAMRNNSILWSASVAKIFVTVAVLQQVEQGRLSLDDDINKYVSFKIRNPTWPDVPITWRMLLTHTSSLNTEDDESASWTIVYGRDTQASLEEQVRQTLAPGGAHHTPDQWRAAKPGTERIYNNEAFDLAALALQGIVHEPFDRYVQHAILEPLSMHDTSYRLAQLPNSRLAVGYASVRQRNGNYRLSPAKTYWAHGDAGGRAMDHQMSCADYPSGCAHTTALDLSRLMLMLMQGGSVDRVKILERSSVELMTTSVGLRNLDGWVQGLGLAGPEDTHGGLVWGHAGDDRGAANAFFFDLKTGVGAIALANAMDPDFTLSYAVTDLDLHLISWFE
jgi:CubicO group peptidase (beta-lactamase class C family)